CNRQGIKKTWSAVNRVSMTRQQRIELARRLAAATREREQRQRDERAVNAKRIALLWSQCVQVTDGDPVHRYLCRRLAIESFEAPQCLRFHRALHYWHAGERIGAFP